MNSLPPRCRGFSLIELMFSMAIGSIILILAASSLEISTESYERISGSVTSDREARAMITQLSADLATAVFNPCEIIEKSQAAWPVDRLGFFSLQPETAQTESGYIGDLCVVNYYIKDLTFSGKTVRCLMRGFRESNDTFKGLRDENTAPLFSAQLNLDEPIAFGVVSFQASPKRRNNAGKWIDWLQNDVTGPEAFEFRIVLARTGLIGKLDLPVDWDGNGNTTKPLGDASHPDRNKNLEIYATTLRFGNHAN